MCLLREGKRDCEKSSLFLTGSFWRISPPGRPSGAVWFGRISLSTHTTLLLLLRAKGSKRESRVFCPVSTRYRLMITWWTRRGEPDRRGEGSKVKLRADRTIAGSRRTINCCSTPGFTALLTGSPEVNSSCQISKHRWEILISNLLVTQSHHKFQHNQQPCISKPWSWFSLLPPRIYSRVRADSKLSCPSNQLKLYHICTKKHFFF